jgi:hypothetical protein
MSQPTLSFQECSPLGTAAGGLRNPKNPMPEDKSTWTASIQTAGSLRESFQNTQLVWRLWLTQIILALGGEDQANLNSSSSSKWSVDD